MSMDTPLRLFRRDRDWPCICGLTNHSVVQLGLCMAEHERLRVAGLQLDLWPGATLLTREPRESTFSLSD
jgi:hypothetical protein